MKVQTDIIIDAPIEKVFTVFSDLGKAEERIAGIKKIVMIEGPAQMQVGTKWKETREMFGKEADEAMWVVELNENKNYVVLAESHGTKYRSEYTFEKAEEGVKVTMVFEGVPQTFVAKILGAMFFFMKKSMEKMLYQDMFDLKKVCEEN